MELLQHEFVLLWYLSVVSGAVQAAPPVTVTWTAARCAAASKGLSVKQQGSELRSWA